MRKYVIGFVCGVLFASASVIYASNDIKVTLFPVKYEINGVTVEQTGDYRTLNLDGRAYVPIRFVAENLDAVVAFDEATKGIKIDVAFNIDSISRDLKAGHLHVEKTKNGSVVTAQIYAGQNYWNKLSSSKMMVESGSNVTITAYLAFYDKDNKVMDKLPISISTVAKGDQLKDVTASSQVDLSDYAFATLEYVTPEPIYAFLPPNLIVTDSTGVLETEQTELIYKNGISKVRLTLGLHKEGFYRYEASLNYYDSNEILIGTAYIQSSTKGLVNLAPGEELSYEVYETATNTDLSKASKYTVDIKVIERISESEF